MSGPGPAWTSPAGSETSVGAPATEAADAAVVDPAGDANGAAHPGSNAITATATHVSTGRMTATPKRRGASAPRG